MARDFVGSARTGFGIPSESRDPYSAAISRTQRPFSFTPDPNDPELALLRTRIQGLGQARQASSLNELARAGLLGSSAAFGVLGEGETETARMLEGADESVFGRRRGEALDLFQQEQNFARELELLRIRGMLERQRDERARKAGLVGGLGRLAGAGLGFALGGPTGAVFGSGIGNFDPFFESEGSFIA
jgi:hypothetical protein